MAFRQAKANAQQHAQEWHGWRDRHHQRLVAIGLPPSVYADEARWLDFLENGHLHRHDDPWRFEFGHFSSGQLAASSSVSPGPKIFSTLARARPLSCVSAMAATTR